MMPSVSLLRAEISWRAFLRIVAAVVIVLAICAADGFLVEPRWLATRTIVLSENPSHRIVHLTDLHYKGGRGLLEAVVGRINDESPDFVCFTGDIVEDPRFLEEALDILARIQRPMYGVPGNHEYWSGASLRKIAACFESTGGAWLTDQQATTADGAVTITGAVGLRHDLRPKAGSGKNILLVHYPEFAATQPFQFDLMLAGHAHGGQVRVPFVGALILPDRVGEYDRGLFKTKAGPLHVSAGVGTWYLPVRFCCRPEIAVVAF